MTLTEFLLARIDEDEAVAREAGRAGSSWVVEKPSRVRRSGEYPRVAEPAALEAAHIARHDPARVLVECEAKRRIVNLMGYVLESWEANHGNGGRSLWPDVNRRERSHARTVLEQLATAHKDHPDYRYLTYR